MAKVVRLEGVELRNLEIRTTPTPPPLPILRAAPDTKVQEPGSGTATYTFKVSRVSTGSGSLAYTSAVTVQTEDRTALADVDYIALPPTRLTFAPNEIEKSVSVTVLSDAVYETDDQFALVLSEPFYATIDRDSQAVDIVSAVRPAFYIGDATFQESVGQVTLTVQRLATEPGSLGYTSTVRVRTRDGRSGGSKPFSWYAGLPYLEDAGKTFPQGNGRLASRFSGDDLIVWEEMYEPFNNGSYTVECYFYWEGGDWLMGFGQRDYREHTLGHLNVFFSGDQMYWQTPVGAANTTATVVLSASFGTIQKGRWYHMALTGHDGPYYWEGFLDGVKRFGVSVYYPYYYAHLGSGPFCLGGYKIYPYKGGPQTYQPAFAGRIADFRVTDGVKYGGTFTPPPAPFGPTDPWFNQTVAALPLSRSAMEFSKTPSHYAATYPADYTPFDKVLTFLPGETSKTITIPVTEDGLPENAEIFTVYLDEPINATLFKDYSNVTIVSATLPTLTVNDATATKTDGSLTFTVTRTGTAQYSLDYATTVTVATQDGTAAAGTHYTAVPPTTLSFGPGETTKTITVPLTDDQTYDPDLTFSLLLYDAALGTLLRTAGTATIKSVAAPSLRVGDATVRKDAGTAVFRVTRAGATASLAYYHSEVTLRTQDGSAKAGTHYAAVDTTVVFEPGETEKTVAVPLLDNRTYEADLSYTVVLSTPLNAVIADGTGAGVIQSVPRPRLALVEASVTADKRAGTLAFTLARSGQPDEIAYYGPTQVTVQTQNGTALAPDEFAAIPPTVLTFAADEAQKTIAVTLVDDHTYRPNRTFTVTLAAPVGAVIDDGEATGIITSLAPPTLSFGDGAAVKTAGSLALTITRSGPAETLAYYTSTVTVRTTDVSAVAGVDYTAVTPTVVTFGPDAVSQTVTVPLLDDHTYRPDRTFRLDPLALTNATNPTNDYGVGTVASPATPVLTINDVRVSEVDGSAVFTVTRSGDNLAYYASSAAYRTQDGTATAPADYTAVSGTLSFAPGETTKTVAVPVIDDGEFEAERSFTLVLSSPVNVTLADASGDGTIYSPPPSTPIFKPVQVGGARTIAGSAATDNLGRSLAISADTLVVSAYQKDHSGYTDAGCVYVYTWNGTDWAYTAQLTAGPYARSLAYFGYAVAISGDTLVVGAYGENSYQGAAYVFHRSGGVWPTTPTARLLSSDGMVNEQFGYAVAVTPTRLVIGANVAEGLSVNEGAAYVFEGSGASWTQVARLGAETNRQNSAEFGVSVAVEGDDVIVGAYRENTNLGAVYVFRRQADGAWVRTQRLTPATPVTNTRFGAALSIDQGMLAIGAPTAGGGYVYVFAKDATGTYAQEVTLTARTAAGTITDSSVTTSDQQGISVVINMTWRVVLAGAVRNNGGRGCVYVYEKVPAGWVAGAIKPVSKLTASDAASNDAFGLPVVMTDTRVVVGAYQRDLGLVSDAGAFYCFRYTP